MNTIHVETSSKLLFILAMIASMFFVGYSLSHVPIIHLVVYVLATAMILRVVYVVNHLDKDTMAYWRFFSIGVCYITLAAAAAYVAFKMHGLGNVDTSDLLFMASSVGLMIFDRRQR